MLLALALAATTTGHTTEPIKPVPQELFSPIPPISETFTKEVPSIRPIPSLKNKVSVVIKPTPKPRVSANHKTRGVASWYCRAGVSRCTRGHSGGMYAAIRRDLLHLRGKVVSVTANGVTIKVRIIDCNCGSHANLIDLYSDAFKQLAPLSRGTVKVTVAW